MDIDNHIPIANYIFVTITAGVLAYVTAMSEDVDKSYEMPPEYADKNEDEETPDTPIDTSDNTESADDNNGYVSSFGAGISGFFAGLGATNQENTQEKDKDQSPIGDDKDYDSLPESLEEKEESEGRDDEEEKEETPERDNNNDERLQETQENKEDGVENSPSKELHGIEEPGSIEKMDRVSIKNEDSLDVIEKKPVTGGTKHNKSSKKSKNNVKRKTSSNKKRKTK